MGSDKATTRSEGGKGKTYKIGRPKRSRERGPSCPRTRIPNSSRVPRASPPSLSLPLPPGRPSLPFSGDLFCYILLSSVHRPPTLVNHLCLSSSARPIGHSLWRSMSCCGLHRPVQGSHPHQCGQGVSCGYLIWRSRLLLGLSPHHFPMASPCGLKSLLQSSSGLPRATWRFSLP